MPPIPGSVRVTGLIAPTDSADTYASHSETYGYGGYRTVADAAARLAITTDRRKEGMLVKQLDTGEIWTLSGGIADINWVLDPLGVADSLRKIVNMGGVWFVDCDNGVDAASRGTFALPLKTINYAISNYGIAWNNDLFICWGSAGGGFDENAFVDGIEMSNETTVIMGVGNPYLDNTNGGASSVVHISAQSCRVLGFDIWPSSPIYGVLIDTAAMHCIIGEEYYETHFIDCSTDVYIDGGCPYNVVRYCRMDGHVGVDINGVTTHVYNCIMSGDGVAGSIAFNINSNGNFVYNIQVSSYETIINTLAGAVSNVVDNVSMSNFTTPIVDANAPGLNTYTNIQTPSQIGPNYTLTQDLRAIYDAAIGASTGYGSGGNVYFVDCDAGVDAAGRGTHALPLKTIFYAVSNYGVAYNNDLFVCWASGGGAFDESAVAGGVLVIIPGIYIIGFGTPRIDNTNGGATAVFTLTSSDIMVAGFYVNPSGAIIGIIANDNRIKVGTYEHNNVFQGCSTDVRLGAACEANFNIHIDSTQGYDIRSDRNKIHDNIITGTGAGGTIGVGLFGGGGPCRHNEIYDNKIDSFEIGINAPANDIYNSGHRNSIVNCTQPITDANNPGDNDWTDNLISPIKTTNAYSYPAGITQEDVYEYVPTDYLDKRVIGSLGLQNMTAGHVVTVRVYEYVSGAAPYQLIDSDTYTVGTDPNPHFDFGTFRRFKITMQVDVTEGVQKDIDRTITVKWVE